MLVPCNPLSYIQQAYGTNWNVPSDSGFHWKNMNQKYFDKYSNKQWKLARRFYNDYGFVNVNKTITHLNEFVQDSGQKISVIENDLEAF